jgi:hypothetical protein
MLSLSWAIKDSYIYILAKNNDLSSVEIETILFKDKIFLLLIIFVECAGKIIAWAHISDLFRPWGMIIVFIIEILILPIIFVKVN